MHHIQLHDLHLRISQQTAHIWLASAKIPVAKLFDVSPRLSFQLKNKPVAVLQPLAINLVDDLQRTGINDTSLTDESTELQES